MNDNEYVFKLSDCNFTKTVMMLFVVITHCLAIWNKNGWFVIKPTTSNWILGLISEYLGTFHTYVFTFVSGYLLYYINKEQYKKSSFKNIIFKRFKRLMIPYIICSCLWVIPFYYYYYQSNPTMILKNFLLGCAPSQLWYLLMLFILNLFFLFIQFVIKEKEILQPLICVLFFFFSLFLSFCSFNYFQFSSCLKYYSFFYMGYYYRKNKGFKVIDKWNSMILLALSLTTFLIFYFFDSLEIIYFKVLKYFVFYICNFFGVAATIKIIGITNYEYLTRTKIYYFLSENNFGIYLIHQQLIWTILYYLNHLPNIIILTLNFIVGILISGLIIKLIKKINIVKSYL